MWFAEHYFCQRAEVFKGGFISMGYLSTLEISQNANYECFVGDYEIMIIKN